MPHNIIQKVRKILDIMPEDIRKIIINKYDGNIQSKNVSKLMAILDKLSDDEKKEFFIFSQNMLNNIGQQIMEEIEGLNMKKQLENKTNQLDKNGKEKQIEGNEGGIALIKVESEE